MLGCTSLAMNKLECKICGDSQSEPLGVDSFLFSTVSYLPEFHEYENYLCGECGIVFSHPQIEEQKLSEFYNSDYWGSINDEGLKYRKNHFSSPIDLANSVTSLKRAYNFMLACERLAPKYPQITPEADDLVIDLGAYQGLFLHALRQNYQVRVLPCDFSQAGMDFARTLLGMKDARVIKDLYSENFDERARFVTMVHFLEHLNDPMRVLRHVRQHLLSEDGFLYIEVPNLHGHPLADPFHFFSYSFDSLQRVLALAGFEIINIFSSSFPPKPQNVWANNDQNLVCLARPTDKKSEFPPLDAAAIRADLRKAYARHSSRGVWRITKQALRDVVKAAYCFVFAVLMERLSPSLMMSMARALGFRRTPSIHKD